MEGGHTGSSAASAAEVARRIESAGAVGNVVRKLELGPWAPSVTVTARVTACSVAAGERFQQQQKSYRESAMRRSVSTRHPRKKVSCRIQSIAMLIAAVQQNLQGEGEPVASARVRAGKTATLASGTARVPNGRPTASAIGYH